MKVNSHQRVIRKQIRQGDVLCTPIDKITPGLKVIPRTQGKVVLALGEVTGHHHHVVEKGVTHYSATGEDAMVSELEVTEAMAMLKHEEHSTIELPSGTYRVEKQQQYQRSWIRNQD